MTAEIARERHQQAAYEFAQQRRLETHEAEIRRLTDERWQRRLLPTLPSVEPVPCDFPGCVT